MSEAVYDFGVVGGGLAGSSFALLMAQKGYKVVIFEKEEYPIHKVCGEYISMESYPFLQRLGVPLSTLELPRITQLRVSSPYGNIFKSPLKPGGFGISRFRLDAELQNRCLEEGVQWVNEKVEKVETDAVGHNITGRESRVKCKYLIGAWGKRSNIDRQLKRNVFFNEKSRLENWVGIKYHARIDIDPSSIALHNFENGYLGISMVEEDTVCICYLMRAENLVKSGNSIQKAEQNILCKNPEIRRIFEQAEMLYNKPLVISQISFEKRSSSEKGILMIGDSAGLITPLCGNGMSMAFRSACMAANCFENNQKTFFIDYDKAWKVEFSQRLRTGRFIQRFFGNKILSSVFIRIMKLFPGLSRWLISKTHGREF